jgi:alpha-1,3-rhamnosyl/mannosyltransferase
MKITIDATSALLRSAGIKSYTYHWVRAMRRIAGPDEIRAFPFLGEFGELDHESSTLGTFPTLARIAFLHLANLPGSPAMNWISTDVFHASNQVHNVPRGAKLTATIHDLTCWLMPQFHTEANVRADKTFAEKVWKRADALIAVSENSRRDAIEQLGIAPEKIHTIYSGVPQQYFDAKATQRERPYVLYVGTIEPRKNLDALLDAWKPCDFDLVIAGATGWGSEKTLARIKAESTYLGYVPEPELPGLFAGASAFVYPSLYEGFGFPVVQAMAAGVPVITSNTSCLPEVTGGAAVLVDPKSPAEIGAAITRVLSSDESALTAKARARARDFTWEACAEKSLLLFRSLRG